MSEFPDELPAGAFLAPLPWWVVVRRDVDGRGGGEGAAAGYLVLDAADGSTCLAVFRDEDLAERFTLTVDFPGRPVAATTPAEALQLVAGLPRVCTHAAFDPPPRVGGRARWVVPLAEVARALRVLDVP